MKFSLKGSEKNKKSYSKEDNANEKKVISILLSAAMISSMVVAGGGNCTCYRKNITLNVFDAHAYGLERI